MIKNSYNMIDIDPNTPVYRTYDVEHLFTMIKSGENLLVRPMCWDDPFENFLFRQPVKTNFGNEDVSLIGKKYFGQCWTLNKNETDALWRIYSPRKNKVRVKTTINKLWRSFNNLNNKRAPICYFIGKINYMKEGKIKSFFSTKENLKHFLYHSGFTDQPKLYFIKRTEFKHENELRIIYYDDDSYDNEKFYRHLINPVDFIEELLFDPRFDEFDNFESRKLELVNSGINGKIIYKSSLYQIPNFNLSLL